MDPRDFDYELPPDRIAQHPVTPRDQARLLVYDRASRSVQHRIFLDLPDLLRRGDLLVLNDTRVLPARLLGKRVGSGGRVELLLLRRLAAEAGGPDEPRRERWEALCHPARRLRPGVALTFEEEPAVAARVEEDRGEGVREVAFHIASGAPLEAVLQRIGRTPLPPYITAPLSDPERYQTIYAREPASAAAPTAGLHFTRRLFRRLSARGVACAYLTLHVGLGTFRPVQAGRVEDHRMHAEAYTLGAAAADAIEGARARGGRVVAVGTTVVRTLETLARETGAVRPGSGWTDIFIYPGHRFRCTDALITNFHLPRSTLLMLVCAFAGREEVLRLYREAIERGYRFYSFGDAMLIL